jgi:hypothetical protein
MNQIERLSFVDDVASLHVKIDNLNVSLVGFCFIRSIDRIPENEDNRFQITHSNHLTNTIISSQNCAHEDKHN